MACAAIELRLSGNTHIATDLYAVSVFFSGFGLRIAVGQQCIPAQPLWRNLFKLIWCVHFHRLRHPLWFQSLISQFSPFLIFQLYSSAERMMFHFFLLIICILWCIARFYRFLTCSQFIHTFCWIWAHKLRQAAVFWDLGVFSCVFVLGGILFWNKIAVCEQWRFLL